MRIYLVDGQILRDAGRSQEALAVFTKGLKELPDNADLLYARAMTAEKMGNYVMMEKDLKQVLARDPDNVDALNALGYSLADHSRRYQEAFGYIQRALDLLQGVLGAQPRDLCDQLAQVFARSAAGVHPAVAETGGAAERLAALVPAGTEPVIHLTITDDWPLAQAFVIIEAVEAAAKPPQ